MIKLTQWDENVVYFNIRNIVAVRKDKRNGGTSVFTVETEDSEWVVKEPAEEVVRRILAAKRERA